MNPVIRFSLLIGEGQEVTGTDGKTYSNASGWIDVTSEVSSWDETEITRQRDGLTAVMTEVAGPVVFCDGRALAGDFSAYVLLKRLFEEYGLHAAAKMRVEERDDVDLDAYTVLHEFDLDFQHYEWEDGKVTLDGTSPTLQQAIKSLGGTKYDIPVSELYPYKFKYSPIQMQSTARYELPMNEIRVALIAEQSSVTSIPLTHIETETIPDRSIVLSTNQSANMKQASKYGTDNYFLEAQGSVNVRMEINFNIRCSIVDDDDWSHNEKVISMDVHLMKNGHPIDTVPLYKNGDMDYRGTVSFVNTISMKNEDRLSLAVQMERGSMVVNNLYFSIRMLPIEGTRNENSLPFYAYWTQTSTQSTRETITFDVTTPATLLGKLLQKISPEGQRFTGSIDFSTVQRTIMLAAAESIRGIEGAQFHTSLNDFISWMETLGFGYEIDGTVLRFAPLATFFDKSKEGIALSEASDVKVEASGDYAYTSLKIGYDKVDYDNINGRYEVNGTFEYATGYTSNEDNELELISHYRADHYGIEFLTWERWKDSTDDQSDNDVFVLACAEAKNDDGQWEFYDKVYFEIDNTIHFYNAILCPYYLVVDNAPRIGIITDYPKFSSTTNNDRTWIVDARGTPSGRFMVSEDIYLPYQTSYTPLFSPFLYKITVGLVESTDIKDYGGIITFPCIDEEGNEVTKKGFLKEASRSVRKEKAEEWTLYAVED